MTSENNEKNFTVANEDVKLSQELPKKIEEEVAANKQNEQH